MRDRLRHTTSYTYSGAVDISHHMLHLARPGLPRQRVKACLVTTNPQAGRLAAQIDHFGNRVAHLTIDAPHTRFDVELRAEVEVDAFQAPDATATLRSEEHTSELQSLMRISYAVFCLQKKRTQEQDNTRQPDQTHNTKTHC